MPAAQPKIELLDDGRLHFIFPPSLLAVGTGPINGQVTLASGSVFNVGPDWVGADTLDDAQEIAHRVGLRYVAEGHPLHDGALLLLPGERPVTHAELGLGLHERSPFCYTVPEKFAATVFGDKRKSLRDGFLEAFRAQRMNAAQAYKEQSMALASSAAENASLNGLDGTGATNTMPDVSLHTATTSTTGASENANSGSYARQACTWNAASSGSKTNSTSLTFSTGGSVAVTYFGTWSSATYGAGTFAIGGAFAAGVTATSITVASGGITLSAS